MTRDEAITRIRAGLRQRTGKAWSVSGGRGTGWGWIRIEAPPKRRVDDAGGTAGGQYYTSQSDCAELAAALGLEKVHDQGVSIPASSAYYTEYVDRAEGRSPSVRGTRYWD